MVHARTSSSKVPVKALGQHFLVDQQVIDHIVQVIHPKHGLTYVEIGPGLGAITCPILPLVDELVVIEYDKYIIPFLEEACANTATGADHLMIIQTDVLSVDFEELAKERQLQVFGNLPYNISTPILFHLITYLNKIDEMHFMLQEEVVDRIVAKPNTKEYGRLTVMIQAYCNVEKLFTVTPDAFNPPPKVYSAIVRLTPKPDNDIMNLVDKSFFSTLVNIAFQQRRKTIRNSLKSLATEDDLLAVGLDLKARAENLSVNDFLRLTQHLKQDKKI